MTSFVQTTKTNWDVKGRFFNKDHIVDIIGPCEVTINDEICYTVDISLTNGTCALNFHSKREDAVDFMREVTGQ